MPNTSSPTRELGHRRTDRDDGAGDVQSGHPVLRPAEPEAQDAHQVRPARHQVPGPPIQTGRAHLHQHLVVGDLGRAIRAGRKHLGRAVTVLHDRPHRASVAAVAVSVACPPLFSMTFPSGGCTALMPSADEATCTKYEQAIVLSTTALASGGEMVGIGRPDRRHGHRSAATACCRAPSRSPTPAGSRHSPSARWPTNSASSRCRSTTTSPTRTRFSTPSSISFSLRSNCRYRAELAHGNAATCELGPPGARPAPLGDPAAAVADQSRPGDAAPPQRLHRHPARGGLLRSS